MWLVLAVRIADGVLLLCMVALLYVHLPAFVREAEDVWVQMLPVTQIPPVRYYGY